MKKFNTLISLLLGTLSLLFTGCQTDTVPPLLEVNYTGVGKDEPILVQSIEVKGDYTSQELSEAVAAVATHRGWTVKSQSNDEVVLFLSHRGNESKLIWQVDNAGYKVYSVSYSLNQNGSRKKRSEPEGWVRNLHKDLKALLVGVY